MKGLRAYAVLLAAVLFLVAERPCFVIQQRRHA